MKLLEVALELVALTCLGVGLAVAVMGIWLVGGWSLVVGAVVGAAFAYILILLLDSVRNRQW